MELYWTRIRTHERGYTSRYCNFRASLININIGLMNNFVDPQRSIFSNNTRAPAGGYWLVVEGPTGGIGEGLGRALELETMILTRQGT